MRREVALRELGIYEFREHQSTKESTGTTCKPLVNGDYWSVVLLNCLFTQSEGSNEWNIESLFYTHRNLLVTKALARERSRAHALQCNVQQGPPQVPCDEGNERPMLRKRVSPAAGALGYRQAAVLLALGSAIRRHMSTRVHIKKTAVDIPPTSGCPFRRSGPPSRSEAVHRSSLSGRPSYPAAPSGRFPVPRNFTTRPRRSNQNGAPSETAAAVRIHPIRWASQVPQDQSGTPSLAPNGSSSPHPTGNEARRASETSSESGLGVVDAIDTASCATE